MDDAVAINEDWTVEVKLAASVLSLRGPAVFEQPVFGARGVLAWNGQVNGYIC